MLIDDEATRPTLLPAVLARADWRAQQPRDDDDGLPIAAEPNAPRAFLDC